MTIDHDEWAKLYIDDPAEFERRRKAVIATAIDAAPEHLQQKLTDLQSSIDQIRASAKTPLDALAKIGTRMQEQLLDLQDQFLHLCQISNVLPEPEVKPIHER